MRRASTETKPTKRRPERSVAETPPAPFSRTAKLELRKLRTNLENCFRGADWALVGSIPFLDMLGAIPIVYPDSPIDWSRKVGPRLDRLGVAFEPDPRYGSDRFSNSFLLFRFPKGCPVDPSRTAYAAARSQIEAAIAAGRRRGVNSFPNFAPIGVSPDVLVQLASDERLRLHAYALALDENVHGLPWEE